MKEGMEKGRTVPFSGVMVALRADRTSLCSLDSRILRGRERKMYSVGGDIFSGSVACQGRAQVGEVTAAKNSYTFGMAVSVCSGGGMRVAG